MTCSHCGKRMEFVGEYTDKENGRRYEIFRCFFCMRREVYCVG